MNESLAIPILLVAGYAAGLIPSAVWVARANGVDIYQVGSGNPGASNVYRTVGKGPAAVVFLLDALKGAVPAALGRWVLCATLICGLIAGAAAVAGHSWPVTRRFKGGRGVATGAGVIAVTFPLTFLVLLAIFALTVALFRKPSVGSLVVIFGLAIATVVDWPGTGEALVVGSMVVMVLIRHSENVKRLVRGEEHGLEVEEASSHSGAARDPESGNPTGDVGGNTI